METGSQQSSGRGVFLSARLVFLAAALVLLVRPSAAQQLTQQWVNTIPNAEAGTAASVVAADSNDSSYVVGTACADSACQTQVLNLVKYEKNGTTAWSAALSGAPAGSSRGTAVALDGAGNVYVAGIAAMISNGPAPGINQLVVAKFSPSGQQLWASYNSSTTDNFGYNSPYLTADSAGDSYVSMANGDTFGPITTIKYDPSGKQLWLASYSLMAFGFHGHAQGIAVDVQGDTYVAVETDDASGFASNYSGLLLKYDPSGNLLLDYHAAHAPPAGVAIDSQGNAYLATLLGPATEASNAETAEQVTKFDPDGNIVWNTQYAPANVPSPNAIALDSADNSYVTGSVGSFANNSVQYSTSKFDANGKFVWEKDYSTQDSEANGIVVDQQNNIIVTGTTNIVLGTGQGNATTIEYDTNGNQLSVATYNNDTPAGMARGKAGIFIAGTYFNGNPSPTANAQMQNSQWVTIEYEERSGSTINIAPASLTFASQTVSSTSSTQTVTLTNTGTAPLSITAAPAISGTNAADFAIVSGTTCTNGASIPGNGSCVIAVTFAPSTTGSEGPATLTITDSDSNNPQTIKLTGTGTAAPAPAVSFSANTVTFPSQPEGTTSGAQSVTLTNTGNASLSISSVTITGSNEFAKTNVTCESALAAGASCIIAVDFQPSATGTQTAAISVADNAASSPQTVTLTGTGSAAAAPAVGLAPSPLDFMAQVVSTASAAQTITLANTGNATLTISGITVAGSDAKEFPVGSSTCRKSLGVGAKCTIPISFAPTAAGAQSATLTVADNANPATQTANLSGIGSNFALSSANTSATVKAGQTATYTVTLSPTLFTDTVAVTCSGAPTATTCAANPASVNLTGSTSAQVTVTVTTTAASGGFLGVLLNGQRMLWVSALAAILMGLLSLSGVKGYRMKPSLVLMVVLLITCLGCGSTSKPSSGNGSNPLSNPTNPSSPTSPGTSSTPAGTSTVTVTATSGSTVRTLPLTLTVD